MSQLEQQEVGVLLLGDAEVGKSTFLSRLTRLKDGRSVTALPVLRDSEQPFVFDISIRGKSLRLEFFDTASPTSYMLLRPAIIVLCFSIVDRNSLSALYNTWKDTIEGHFNYDDQIPIIVLGLKRDLRKENDPDSILAHEAVVVAQKMRCDRYCECSAITGELCDLVFEDIVRTAAMTTTETGGRTPGPDCTIM